MAWRLEYITNHVSSLSCLNISICLILLHSFSLHFRLLSIIKFFFLKKKMFQTPLVFVTGLLSFAAHSKQYENITIQSSGIERWYLRTLPPNFDSTVATPVILSFHGGGRNATQQYHLSQLSNPDFNDFAIAVYPNGKKVSLLAHPSRWSRF